jgi:hypothetical protein
MLRVTCAGKHHPAASEFLFCEGDQLFANALSERLPAQAARFSLHSDFSENVKGCAGE